MVETSKARVAAVSSTTLYGRGVFTTLNIQQALPLLWPKHWTRLVEHAGKLNIDLKQTNEELVSEALLKLLAVNKVDRGLARVILLGRSGDEQWLKKLAPENKTDLLIITFDPPRLHSEALTLAVSPYRITTFSPLLGVKSVNYLDRLLPWEEARKRDFDEAVVLNERGEIVSATMANIFWVKDGTVQTPSLSTGAVAGITREAVIELATKLFIPVVEGVYEMGDLVDADEIFLTSSSLGLGIVTTFDFRQYSVATGSIASKLLKAFQAR